MRARALALAAAVPMGAPGLAAGSEPFVWVDVSDAAHPDTRIPVPLQP